MNPKIGDPGDADSVQTCSTVVNQLVQQQDTTTTQFGRNPMLHNQPKKAASDLILKKNYTTDDAAGMVKTGNLSEAYLDVLYDEWIIKLKESLVSNNIFTTTLSLGEKNP